MRVKDLGATRKSPVSQIGNKDFGHVYKGEIRVQEPHVEFLVHDSIRPTKHLIRLNRVELKKQFWKENGITFKQLSK